MNGPIVFNGKAYHSLDEMPEKERKAYEAIVEAFADTNANGMPDVFEGGTGRASQEPAKVVISNRVISRLDELSPQEQAELQQAMRQLDINGNGIPDFLESLFGMQAPAQTKSSLVSREPVFPTSEPVIGRAPDAQPSRSRQLTFIILVVMLLLLGFASAIMLFFLAR